jgi:hypothetical protein
MRIKATCICGGAFEADDPTGRYAADNPDGDRYVIERQLRFWREQHAACVRLAQEVTP